MDPNAVLERILWAIQEQDAPELANACQDLVDWLDQGGFPPELDVLVAFVRDHLEISDE